MLDLAALESTFAKENLTLAGVIGTSEAEVSILGWSGPPEAFNSTDGVCDCGFNRWDPSCSLTLTTASGEDVETAAIPTGCSGARDQCVRVDRELNDLDVELSVPLAVCKSWPAEWECDPLLYDAGDGVCDCCCGAWDPDCDQIDFENAAIDSTTFGCPPAFVRGLDERYICSSAYNNTCAMVI